MSGRVRIDVARRFLAGFLPAVALLASAIDRPAFAADRFPLALKDDRGVTVRLASGNHGRVAVGFLLLIFHLAQKELQRRLFFH